LLVPGIADAHALVSEALLELGDVSEPEVLGRAGILRDAVEEPDLVVREEGQRFLDLLERRAAQGDDDGAIPRDRTSALLEQGTIARVARGDLEVSEVEAQHEVERRDVLHGAEPADAVLLALRVEAAEVFVAELEEGAVLAVRLAVGALVGRVELRLRIEGLDVLLLHLDEAGARPGGAL